MAAQAFAAGSVLVFGQVQEEVCALPHSVTFGTVKQGEEAGLKIALIGVNAKNIKNISVALATTYPNPTSEVRTIVRLFSLGLPRTI